MAEFYAIKDKKVIPKSKTPEVDGNLVAAREWYKKKDWPKGMRITLSQAGGPLGNIPNGCLTISFKPSNKSKGVHVARCVCVAQNRRSFMEELEELYQLIYAYSKKWVV